jgi:hypothetical protein
LEPSGHYFFDLRIGCGYSSFILVQQSDMRSLFLTLMLLCAAECFAQSAPNIFTQTGAQIIGVGCTTAFYLDPLCKPVGVGVKSSGIYPTAPLGSWSGTGSQSGTTFTIQSFTSGGPLGPGNVLSGSGVPTGETVVSGTPSNTPGATFVVSQSASISTEAITAVAASPGDGVSSTPAWYTVGDSSDPDPTDPTISTTAQWETKYGWVSSSSTYPTCSTTGTANNAAMATFLQQRKVFTNTGHIYYISLSTGNDSQGLVNCPDLPFLTSVPVMTALEATTSNYTGTCHFTSGSNVLHCTANLTGTLAVGDMVTAPSGGISAGEYYIRGQFITASGDVGTWAMSRAPTTSNSGETFTGYHYSGGVIVIEAGIYAITNLNFAPFYNYGSTQNPGWSLTGTPGYPLYVMGFPGSPPLLEVGIQNDVSYAPTTASCCVTFDGLIFWQPLWGYDPSGAVAAIDYDYASQITVINNEFAGFDKAVFIADQSSGILVQNNVFHDMASHSVYIGSGTACETTYGLYGTPTWTFGVDTNFATDYQAYLNLQSCGAAYYPRIIGNIAYVGSTQVSAGLDVFHLNSRINGGIVTGNIVSASGAVVGEQTGDYNVLVNGNLFFANSSECFQNYTYASSVGNATLPATSASFTMNSYVPGHPFSLNEAIYGSAYIPNATTLTTVPGGGGAGSYVMSAASTNSSPVTTTVAGGYVSPSMNWDSDINNVCWMGAAGDTIAGSEGAASGYVPYDVTGLSYTKNTVFNNNKIVTTSTGSAGTTHFWFRQNSYPETYTIQNNTLYSVGSSGDVMYLDVGAGQTGVGTLTGAYPFSGSPGFTTYFPTGNTNANPNFQAASESLVYTPGAFNFQSSSLTGCCNLH